MSGPSASDFNKLQQTSDLALKTSQEQTGLSKEDRAKRDELIKPTVDFYSGVAKGGDSLMTAIAPVLAQVSKSAARTRENIYDTVPAGPGRDVALSQLERDKQDTIAGTKTNTFLSALDNIANIANGFGSYSLQELGAGLQANQTASTSMSNLIQTKAARKAAALSPLSALASGVGSGVGLAIGT